MTWWQFLLTAVLMPPMVMAGFWLAIILCVVWIELFEWVGRGFRGRPR